MLKMLCFFIFSSTLFGCQEQKGLHRVEILENVDIMPLKKEEELTVKRASVTRGQGLFQAMQSITIESSKALELINALRDEVEFSKLKVGDRLEGTFDSNDYLVAFSFSQNPAEKHVLKLNQDNGTWDYSFDEQSTHWHSRILEGELREGSTLQADLIAQGLSRSVVAEVVNVLLCKINFRMHARMGDKYRIFLSERMFNEVVIDTKVLYTSYRGRIAGFSEAYWYEDEEKGSTYTAHYTADGQALIRSGLRYPLSRLHIRSGYGFRIHPVTGRRVMHRGVDLRGRRGSPVHAVARGLVVDSSYNRFAGNQVAIRHSDGSTSYYLHLHKRRVKKGDRVISNQIIGTVGATGRVTGPHLHFGFRDTNGRWIDPMTKRMIATPKLKGKRYERLQQQISEIKGSMQDLQISKVAKYLLARIPNMDDEFSSEPFSYQNAKLKKTLESPLFEMAIQDELEVVEETLTESTFSRSI